MSILAIAVRPGNRLDGVKNIWVYPTERLKDCRHPMLGRLARYREVICQMPGINREDIYTLIVL